MFLGGHCELVHEDLSKLPDQAKKIGLELNASKSELTVIGQNFHEIFLRFSNECPAIKLIAAEDAKLLGSAIGSSALPFILTENGNMIKELCKILDLLPRYTAFLLLKNCFSEPQLMYILCTAPTFCAPDVISQIDSELRSLAERILNLAMDEITRAQKSLAVKMGGFCLQNTIDLSSSAYLSSVKANSAMIGQLLNDHALATWMERSHATPPDTQTSKPKSWMEPIYRHLNAPSPTNQ